MTKSPLSGRFVDVAVVGAGPGGATAARNLAQNGCEVVLLDAARFPRDKPCGGGLPLRAVTWMNCDISAQVCGRVRKVAIDGGFCGRLLVSTDSGPKNNASAPMDSGAVVVDRAQFDQWLTARAVDCGAHFVDKWRCRKAERVTGGFRLHSTNDNVTAKHIVIADGAISTVGRQLGFVPNQLGICLKAEVPMKVDADPERAFFHLACIRDGYAWGFPFEKNYTLGVGCRRSKVPEIKALLKNYVARIPELRGQPLQSLRGAPIPHFDPTRPDYNLGNAFLIGDAAGLVDPLTGEGIYWAMLSGTCAARAILQQDDALYPHLLSKEVLPELGIADQFARRFRSVPLWSRRLAMSLPAFKRRASTFVELLTGNRTYRSMRPAKR